MVWKINAQIVELDLGVRVETRHSNKRIVDRGAPAPTKPGLKHQASSPGLTNRGTSDLAFQSIMIGGNSS